MSTSSAVEDSTVSRSPEGFYNTLAPSYDRMVPFRQRVEQAGCLVSTLVQRFRLEPTVGIDLGCGTGAFACALARAGFRASGMDIAEEMLTQARGNAKGLGLTVRFVHGSLQALPSPFEPRQADLVLCLGNTLPHLLDRADLVRAFLGIAGLLAPSGLAVVQMLNYDRILDRQERIVSVDRAADAAFVRFYDFLDSGLLRFNLLRVTWEGDTGRPEPLISVLLHPYRRDVLCAAACEAGLEVLATTGDSRLAPYDAETSETLLLVCRRRGIAAGPPRTAAG
jgi:SAM-dependent methyltransferase